MRAGGAVGAGGPSPPFVAVRGPQATPAGVSRGGGDERVIPRAYNGGHARALARGKGLRRARNGARPKADASAGGESTAGGEQASGGGGRRGGPDLGAGGQPPTGA